MSRGHVAAGLLPLLVVGACSNAPNGLMSPTGLMAPSISVPYSRSNAIIKQGFSEVPVGTDRYRITIGGNPASPRAHMEKVATIRAAEIGVEQRHRYFKVESFAVSETCTPATEATHKFGKTNEVRTKVLTAEVVYAKAPPDATYLESKKTFEELRPTLDTDQLVPEQPLTPQAPCT